MLNGVLIVLSALAAGPEGQIAFICGTTPDDYCVSVLNLADDVTNRVGPGNRDGAPVWSPDGEWLAFETQASDGRGIYVVRSDGTEARALTHQFGWNQNPRWSPEGKRLAYSANEWQERRVRMMVYDLETNTETQWGGPEANLLRPVWAPTMKLLDALRPEQVLQWGIDGLTGIDWLVEGGTLIAIGLTIRDTGLSTDLFVVTQDMAAPLPAWIMPSEGHYAEWAAEPNLQGDKLAFESNDGGDREIFVLSKNGSVDVSNHREADWNPAWAPDGEWLAFESFRDGRRGLYRVYTDTARVYPVAVTPNADNWCASWAPNGEYVAFVSNRTGDPEIFVTSLDGTDIRQLTDRPGPDYVPSWRPENRE